jgi:hypothetical protein
MKEMDEENDKGEQKGRDETSGENEGQEIETKEDEE